MRTYTFQCLETDCGTIFEEDRELDDKRKPRCPKCKSRNVRKKITPISVIYKDEGFTQHRGNKEVE